MQKEFFRASFIDSLTPSEKDDEKLVTNKNYYLINAIYQWCLDSQLSPHILVVNNENLALQLPKNFSNSKELVFNISNTAVKNLTIGEQNVEFNARFNGIACSLNIDIKIFYIYLPKKLMMVYF